MSTPKKAASFAERLAQLTKQIPRVQIASPRGPVRLGTSGLRDSPVFSYYLVLILTLALTGIGLMMVFSASTVKYLNTGGNPFLEFLSKPALIILVGLTVMFIASRMRVSQIRNLAWVAFGFGVLLQLGTLPGSPIAYEVAGNRNWIILLGQRMQPSEFLKFGLCLVLGAGLARLGEEVTNFKKVALHLGLPAFVACALVIQGNDMGTMMVFLALIAGAGFISGMPRRWFGIAFLVALFGVAVLISVSGSRRHRVLVHLGLATGTDSSFQIDHAWWALGAGGLTGVGPGASREKWNYLPAATTDFIYAILGEEFGLAGTLLVLVLFLLLALGMFRIIQRSRDPFIRLTTAAATSWIVFQAVVNIAVVVSLLPVLGVPLPLVSSGGSSMVATLAMMGVVLAFARVEPGAPEMLAGRRSLVRRTKAVAANAGRKGD